jgi:hypothetical protein
LCAPDQQSCLDCDPACTDPNGGCLEDVRCNDASGGICRDRICQRCRPGSCPENQACVDGECRDLVPVEINCLGSSGSIHLQCGDFELSQPCDPDGQAAVGQLCPQGPLRICCTHGDTCEEIINPRFEAPEVQITDLVGQERVPRAVNCAPNESRALECIEPAMAGMLIICLTNPAPAPPD